MTGVQLVNVHALGGHAMLHAAVQAISAGQPMGADRPRLLAVTVLTSMDQKAMRDVGIGGRRKAAWSNSRIWRRRPAWMAWSLPFRKPAPYEKACGRDFLIVTPGVRPERQGFQRQRKIRRPSPHGNSHRSHQSGRGFSSVGRPILTAPDPRAATQAIVDEIAAAK